MQILTSNKQIAHISVECGKTQSYTHAHKMTKRYSPIQTDRRTWNSRSEKWDLRCVLCERLWMLCIIVNITPCFSLHFLAGCCSISPESQLATLSLTPISSGPACSYMLIVVFQWSWRVWLPHYSKNVKLTTRGLLRQDHTDLLVSTSQSPLFLSSSISPSCPEFEFETTVFFQATTFYRDIWPHSPISL